MRALTATQRVADSADAHDLAASCTKLRAAAIEWDSAATLSRPLAPVLRRLGWIPQIGGDLRAAPDAIAMAQTGTAAGVTACTVVEPALKAATNPARVAVAVAQLRKRPELLTTMQGDLKQAQAAWTRLAPLVTGSARLRPYRTQLSAIGDRLPQASDALAVAQRLQGQLPWLLGLDAPRRYMVVLQNPFELRPTGGFIGMVCVIQVERAQLTVNGCKNSYAYSTPAPTTDPMPMPYSRYLQLGNYYLRDANWSPDFPTTAARLQVFWSLNKQPAVDGVLGVNLYALGPLLQATGSLVLDDGTHLNAGDAIDTILARYYDDMVYRDKEGIGKLLPELSTRLLQIDPSTLPGMAAALEAILTERHLLIAVNDPSVMRVMAERGWDGGIHPFAGDTLRIVDSDVGYGGVNAFVERLTHYDVDLSSAVGPITATLTLTYTNRYSPWAEARTSHDVYGKCTDPHTLQLVRQTGCYADYLRVYVPKDSRLLRLDGLDERFDVDHRYERAVFGGYLRVNPGEQRVVKVRYQVSNVHFGSLSIEKQSGTAAPPILVTAHTTKYRAEFWTSGRTDLALTYRAGEKGLSISGPADDSAAAPFTENTAFINGLQQWQQRNYAQAIQTWQQGRALDLALDHARMLADRGAPESALSLTRGIEAIAPDGRAMYETATILEARGDLVAAERLYQHVSEHSADNPLPLLRSARLRAALGQPLPDLQGIRRSSAVIRRWRSSTDKLEEAGDLRNVIPAMRVLVQLMPDDHVLALHYVDLLLRNGQRNEAVHNLTVLAEDESVWGRLAAAQAALVAGQPGQAASIYEHVLPLATTYESAYRLGDGLRDVGNKVDAVRAFKRAAALEPGSIWPLLAIGDTLRVTDPATARSWYAQAREVDLTSGEPDFALGTLLLETNDRDTAIPFLEAAAAKQPDERRFQETLRRVRAEGHLLNPNPDN